MAKAKPFTVGCEHKRINCTVVDDQPKRFWCEQCRVLLKRVACNGEWVYVPVSGRPTIDIIKGSDV